MRRRTREVLEEVLARLASLEHETELVKTVLMVREPGSGVAAEAFDGLRKQVIASATERRSHVAQLATMAVAVSRATSLEDVRALVDDWMRQADVRELFEVPAAERHLVFEDLDGGSLQDAADIDVVEPAYFDAAIGRVIRTGRARRRAEPPIAVEPSIAAEPDDRPTDVDDATETMEEEAS